MTDDPLELTSIDPAACRGRPASTARGHGGDGGPRRTGSRPRHRRLLRNCPKHDADPATPDDEAHDAATCSRTRPVAWMRATLADACSRRKPPRRDDARLHGAAGIVAWLAKPNSENRRPSTERRSRGDREDVAEPGGEIGPEGRAGRGRARAAEREGSRGLGAGVAKRAWGGAGTLCTACGAARFVTRGYSGSMAAERVPPAESRRPGRPRVWASEAERAKAYRARRAAELADPDGLRMQVRTLRAEVRRLARAVERESTSRRTAEAAVVRVGAVNERLVDRLSTAEAVIGRLEAKLRERPAAEAASPTTYELVPVEQAGSLPARPNRAARRRAARSKRRS